MACAHKYRDGRKIVTRASSVPFFGVCLFIANMCLYNSPIDFTANYSTHARRCARHGTPTVNTTSNYYRILEQSWSAGVATVAEENDKIASTPIRFCLAPEAAAQKRIHARANQRSTLAQLFGSQALNSAHHHHHQPPQSSPTLPPWLGLWLGPGCQGAPCPAPLREGPQPPVY